MVFQPTDEANSRATRGDQSSLTSTVFTLVAFIFLTLRMYTRGIIVHNIGPEDWTICVSWLCSLGLTVCIWLEVSAGQGHHIQYLSAADLYYLQKYLYFSLFIYQLGLVVAKISILCQYYRIFPGRSIRLGIYIMGSITVVYGFLSVFDNVFMCTPVAFFWDSSIPNGHCINHTVVWFINAGINIVTDLLIFLLPMPELKQLQLPRKQKIGLMLVFALGGFVCLVSILRLQALHAVTNSTDVTWENGPIAYWSSVELNVAIICASLPTLKAFAARYIPKLLANPAKNANFSFRPGNASQNSKRAAYSQTKSQSQSQSQSQRQGSNAAAIELHKKHYDELGDGDLGGIQVVTVMEQERQEMRAGQNSISSQSHIGPGRAFDMV